MSGVVMNHAELRELADWIAHDTSDPAQRYRAVLRPVVGDLIESAARFAKSLERYDHHRRAIMRRKIRRVVSSATEVRE